MNNFGAIEFATNPDPRCPCVLLLDTSYSMAGPPINALNQGLQTFQSEISQDALAKRRVEVAIITFGNQGVQLVQDFVTAGQFQPPHLTAGGGTPMGEAINLGIDILRNRKTSYQNNGIDYYRPWIFIITDGAPTDQWQVAAQRVRSEEDAKAFLIFPIGVAGADMNMLSQLSTQRPPLWLKELQFVEFFKWLSKSQKIQSASKIGEQIGLPTPAGWATV
ncbi:MAG: VWA domain-containing protein [Ktedonobacteraceae bacterium]